MLVQISQVHVRVTMRSMHARGLVFMSLLFLLSVLLSSLPATCEGAIRVCNDDQVEIVEYTVQTSKVAKGRLNLRIQGPGISSRSEVVCEIEGWNESNSSFRVRRAGVRVQLGFARHVEGYTWVVDLPGGVYAGDSAAEMRIALRLEDGSILLIDHRWLDPALQKISVPIVRLRFRVQGTNEAQPLSFRIKSPSYMPEIPERWLRLAFETRDGDWRGPVVSCIGWKPTELNVETSEALSVSFLIEGATLRSGVLMDFSFRWPTFKKGKLKVKGRLLEPDENPLGMEIRQATKDFVMIAGLDSKNQMFQFCLGVRLLVRCDWKSNTEYMWVDPVWDELSGLLTVSSVKAETVGISDTPSVHGLCFHSDYSVNASQEGVVIANDFGRIDLSREQFIPGLKRLSHLLAVRVDTAIPLQTQSECILHTVFKRIRTVGEESQLDVSNIEQEALNEEVEICEIATSGVSGEPLRRIPIKATFENALDALLQTDETGACVLKLRVANGMIRLHELPSECRVAFRRVDSASKSKIKLRWEDQ